MSKIATEQAPEFWQTVWPVICVDFDGVLNTYAGWTGKYEEYPPKRGFHNFLASLHADDFFIVILTARHTDNLHTVEEWFIKHDAIQLIDMITNIKCPAEIYVDDRALKFKGGYIEALLEIKNYRPYWETTKPGNPNVWGTSNY